MAVVTNVGDAVPSSRMQVDDAAALAQFRRGIEPIRIVIPPQQTAAFTGGWDAPMPMLL